MLILLINNNKYTVGFFSGFCQTISCRIKSIEIDNNTEILFNALKKESPKLVFINVKLAMQILNLSFEESTEKQLFLKENNISLYVIGKIPSQYNKTQFKFFFEKNFTEPLKAKEIVSSINSRMLAIGERQSDDRRNMTERRKHHEKQETTSLGIYKVPEVFNIDGGLDFLPLDSNVSFKIPDTLNIRPDSKQSLHFGPLTIDYHGKSIFVNNTPVSISPKEFKLIELLTMKPGSLVAIEEIIKKIWGNDKNATKADVHQYMYLLRKKLEKDPYNPHLIVTVKGFGYKLALN